jgi:acyl-CoA synthetase (AMP-forming)/AMP-acid ligase II
MHFMQRPLRWLEAASRFAGTSTAAPNFALAKVADRVAAGGDFSFDLRPLQRIVLGAEPLRARTLSAFAQALAPFGFRAEALVPCYGLAESTVHCTHSPAGAGPQTYGFHADTLRQRQVRPMAAEDRVDVALLVGNGLSGDELHETIIVDPETGQAAQGDAVGEIWFRGPSVGQGYWNRPQDSAQTFEARLTPGGPTWLRTGDLGFLHDGHLFVTGRQKDLIIIRGRNIHPEDVEEVVRRVSPEIGDGATAVESPLEPGVLILAEARGRGFSDPNDVLRRIREAVTAAFEVEVAGIQLLPPLHLPRTTSGKVRRGHALAQWSAGTLRPTAAWPPAAILSAVDG